MKQDALLDEISDVKNHDNAETSECKELQADALALGASCLSISGPDDAINDFLAAQIAHAPSIALGAI
jgi:hypothetical protein